MKAINKKRLLLLLFQLLLCMVLLQIILGNRAFMQSDDNMSIQGNNNISANFSGFNQVALGSIDVYESIIQRPLFVMTRSNVVEETRQVEQTNGKPPPLLLIGVVITPETKTALLSNTQSKEVITLKSEELFKGWKLSEIEHNRVVFVKDARIHELLLEAQDSQKPLTKSQPRRR